MAHLTRPPGYSEFLWAHKLTLEDHSDLEGRYMRWRSHQVFLHNQKAHELSAYTGGVVPEWVPPTLPPVSLDFARHCAALWLDWVFRYAKKFCLKKLESLDHQKVRAEDLTKDLRVWLGELQDMGFPSLCAYARSWDPEFRITLVHANGVAPDDRVSMLDVPYHKFYWPSGLPKGEGG